MLKTEFRQGCRQIIGLDGTFFKSITSGALLATIRKDSDNKMFPIFWAVVNGEKQSS